MTGKEYCAEYWLNDLLKSMDRCTGRHDITEIILNITVGGPKDQVFKIIMVVKLNSHEKATLIYFTPGPLVVIFKSEYYTSYRSYLPLRAPHTSI